MYWELQSFGITDPRLIGDRFWKAPIRLILEALNELRKQAKNKYNHESLTAAYGWAWLINSFKSKDAPGVAYSQLIPFPDESGQIINRVFAESTLKIIKKAIKNPHLINHQALSVVLQMDASLIGESTK